MNHSIGTDSFGKSLLEKRPDISQQESVNDLWKGSFSSSQDTVQNTNEVYENLLRICEGLDAALPEIQSTVNKGGLHIDEHNENNRLDTPFLQNTFDDIETSLDDIEIYGDIMNPVMLGNDYQSLFFNQNFDTSRNDPYIPLDPTNSLDQNQIFADNEIEQYLAHNSFKLNSENFASDREREREDDQDPLQLWRKLNCKKIHEMRDLKDKFPEPNEQVEAAEKPTKSVLAIFDFTLPSFSSSASSYALSSPEEKALTQDEVSMTPKTSKPSSPSIKEKKCKTSLPILVKPACESENSLKKEKPEQTKSYEILRQDLILSSSSSRESSPSTTPKPGTSKSCKRTKTESAQVKKKSKSVPLSDPAHCIKARKKHKKKKPSEDSVTHKKITSPTLKAGAAYIEQQLCTLLDSKKKSIKPANQKPTTPKSTQNQKSFKKEPAKPEKRRNRKEKDPNYKKYVTRSSSQTKETGKGKKQKAEKQDDWKWLYCSSLSSSPISTPSSKTKSSSLSSKSSTAGSPKPKTNTRRENDENNNRLKVRGSEMSAKKKGKGLLKTELRRKH